eukprot:scaffold244911_cov17-Tisochrysis_lutea.AAC.1
MQDLERININGQPCTCGLLLQALWSFCVYLEAVSVLPQLRMIQKSKVCAAFLCAHSHLQSGEQSRSPLSSAACLNCVSFLKLRGGSRARANAPSLGELRVVNIMEGNKYLLQALGSGLWPVMVLLSEIVQTFILADFWWVQQPIPCQGLNKEMPFRSFCKSDVAQTYYYVKSYAEGTGVIRLPTGVV